MAVGTIVVSMVDGAKVAVPDSLELITPYVLQEQHDWFEDEIRFVRLLLQAGDYAIDIGANYGVYTVSMAKAVGPAGHVWAFEPGSHAAEYLEHSVAENGYTHVTLDRHALSSSAGSARLSLSAHSEYGALQAQSAGGPSEPVAVTTLDDALDTYGWDRIDFVKIDAEGEEANIVAGAARFFETMSPLVQYEVLVGDGLRLDLAEMFAARGYASYRLVPALNALVPFEGDGDSDRLLNLFACKPQRAQNLADRGWLVTTLPSAKDRESCRQIARDRAAAAGETRPSALRRVVDRVRGRGGKALSGVRELDDALALHALSRDPALPTRLRLCALEASLHGLMRACHAQSTPLRLASLVRAAQDFGSWRIVRDGVTTLSAVLAAATTVDADEPFLAPVARFDSVPRREPLRDWLFAATLEAFDRASSFSSFYDSDEAAQRFGEIERLGYADANVARRLELLRRRAVRKAASRPP